MQLFPKSCSSKTAIKCIHLHLFLQLFTNQDYSYIDLCCCGYLAVLLSFFFSLLILTTVVINKLISSFTVASSYHNIKKKLEWR